MLNIKELLDDICENKDLKDMVDEAKKSFKNVKDDVVDKVSDDVIQVKGHALEKMGQDGAQDQLSNKGIKRIQIGNGSVTGYSASGLTRQEQINRGNYKSGNLDLAARKKIVDDDGKVEPSLVSKAKDVIDNTSIGNQIRPITQHVADNAGLYGAAAAGLGAYGLYKHLKKKRR